MKARVFKNIYINRVGSTRNNIWDRPNIRIRQNLTVVPTDLRGRIILTLTVGVRATGSFFCYMTCYRIIRYTLGIILEEHPNNK